MTSDHERFDAEKVRHKIFQPRRGSILMTIRFIGGTARILKEKGRLQDFMLLADRSIELLQGNSVLKKEMLIKIVNCDLKLEDAHMIKYFVELNKLLNDSIGQREALVSNLLKIGQAYFRTAHYRNSLEYTLKALNIARELKNKGREGLCCLLIGNAHSHLSEYNNAIEYYQKGLTISTELGDPTGIASNTGGLGNVYVILGEYEKAISFYEESLAVSTEIGDKSGIAIHTGNLGNLYYSLGEYKMAISCHETALQISSELGDQSGIASNTGSLGNAYYSLGEYQKAIRFFEKGLAISTEIGDPSGIAMNIGNLGSVYHSLGEYGKAISYCEEGLKISTEIGDQLNIATNTANLGSAYFSLGEYEKAIGYYERGLKISTEIGDQLGIASYSRNLGNAYHSLGEYEKSISFYKEGLAISTEIGDRSGSASSIGMLGNAYRSLEQYEKAISYYKNGLEISVEMGNASGIVSNTVNLGTAYRILGQYEKAIGCHEKGLTISTELGDRSGMATISGNLGRVFLSLKEYEKAINFFRKGLKIGVEIREPKIESLCLCNIGCAYYFEGLSNMDNPETLSKLQQAASYLQRSVIRSDQVFSCLDVDQNKISFTKEYFIRYVMLMSCLLLLERIAAALLVIDLGKAKALHAFMVKQMESESDDLVNYARKIWKSIDNKEEQLQIEEFKRVLELKRDNSSVLFFSFDDGGFLNIWVLNGAEDITTLQQSESSNDIFRFLEVIFNDFRVNLNRDSSFHKLDSDFSSGWEKMQPVQMVTKPVDDKSADATKQPQATDFTKSKNTPSRDPPPAEESTFFNATSEATVSPECVLQTLHQVLVHPVRNLIKGTKLIIVPDEFLFFVPFCTLQDENGCRLSENYSIQITPSLHTLVSSMTRPRDPSLGFALFVGNPTVGNVSFRGDVPSVLPNATEEVKCLAPLFDAKPLVESEATKERVLQFIQGASVIHIAAHGEPERGEILLAPNPNVPDESSSLSKEDSYLLKQQDIMDINVNARLVVLCCCHTGKGKISSEGVIGLTRAFLAAGARSVLATLWPIHDKATKEFMEIFYGEIFKETSVCEALRMAMNMFQDHQNKEFCSFKIWAPFTIYGEDVKFTQHDIEEIKEKSRAMYS